LTSPVAADTGRGVADDLLFARCYRFVRACEGGYVEDPDDPGGATKWGVTQGTYDAYRTRKGQQRRPVRDMREDECWAIYRTYWDGAGCAALEWPLALAHFDASIHHGAVGAARLLKDALPGGEPSPGAAWAYLRARRRYMLRIVKRRPRSLRFLWGWIKRLRKLKRAMREPR
jgi:hypothetical protein